MTIMTAQRKENIYKIFMPSAITLLIFIGGINIQKMNKIQDQNEVLIQFMTSQNEKNLNFSAGIKENKEDLKIVRLYIDENFVRK